MPTSDVPVPDDVDELDDLEPDPEDFDVEMPPPPPRPVSERMIGAAMVGLHGIIYGEKEQPAAVLQADGAPPNDDDVQVDLDFDDPSASRMVVRRREP